MVMVLPFRVESNKDFAVFVPVYRIREELYQASDYYKIIVMQTESIYSFLLMAQAFARITLKAYQQTDIQGLVPNHGCIWTGAKHLLHYYLL
jgi:flavorubredoxin